MVAGRVLCRYMSVRSDPRLCCFLEPEKNSDPCVPLLPMMLCWDVGTAGAAAWGCQSGACWAGTSWCLWLLLGLWAQFLLWLLAAVGLRLGQQLPPGLG